MGVSASVLGASGFSGGEVLRILAGHPAIDLAGAAGGVQAGRPLADVQPHLAGVFDHRLLPLEEAVELTTDVCFSCLPAGELKNHAGAIRARVLIDLADDHRSDDSWVYGLTEFCRAELTGATRIANPGCYPTAVLLALIPFARAGLVEGPVVVDALSGVSGAGRKGEDHLLFAARDGSSGPYGSIPHRHVPEMERYLERFGDFTTTVSFTPHLIPTARGLISTVRARLARPTTDAEALDVLKSAYENERFVQVLDDWPATKAVLGSNGVHVHARVDERAGWIVATAAIDNLGKGAAGQAIQNVNVAVGLEEWAGLTAVGVWP